MFLDATEILLVVVECFCTPDNRLWWLLNVSGHHRQWALVVVECSCTTQALVVVERFSTADNRLWWL